MIDEVFGVLDNVIFTYNAPVFQMKEIASESPFSILIRTILSARTRDNTLLKISDGLFSRIKNFDDLEKIPLKELENLIYPVGFYRTKARHLKKLAYIIRHEFSGKIPETIDGLVRLPGVGRKTANLVLSVAFNKQAICVDTHVHRIVNRWGYIKTKTPYETEMKLRDILPKKYWHNINFYLVALGQNICKPISPFCSKCPVYAFCKRIGVERHR